MSSAVTILHGAIPHGFPRGVHYRIGPDITADPTSHMLDCQGRIDRVSFGSRVTLLSERVVTPCGGRPTFGKGGAGLRLHNPANTSLLHKGGRLFALWEGGQPVEVHAETLETLAQNVPLAGARVGAPVSSGFDMVDSTFGLGGEAVGSHPVTEAETSLTAILLSTISRTHMRYRIAEIDTLGSVVRQRSFTIGGFTAVHGGFSVTRDFYIVFTPNMSLDLCAYAQGKCSVADCVTQVSGAPTAIHLIPRRSGVPKIIYTTGCFVTHTVNAYQTRTGHIVVDAMASSSLAHLKILNVGMRRFVIDVDARSCETSVVHHGPIEFPSIHPDRVGRTYRFAYAAVSPWGWCKMDVDTGETIVASCEEGPHAEPTFVPRAGGTVEDDGWIIGYVLSNRGKRLCIVDARTMKLCCELDASGANAMGLHGLFVPTI